jgi:hypothetical protein
MALKLVQLGLSGAAMFDPHGEVLQPSEVLRKKPIIVERGSFRPVTKVNIDMIESAKKQFMQEPEVNGKPVVELMEITMRNLLSGGDIDLRDFLSRADLLSTAGKTVLISDYSEYYRLAAYLGRYTNEPIAVTMGAQSILDLFSEQYYEGLEGGILEAFGRLFTRDLRIYVYPLLDAVTGELTTADNIKIPKDLVNLYEHLVDRARIRAMTEFDRSVLHIFSRDVLRRIKDNDETWEQMVPPEIAEVIKKRRFFGWQEKQS